MGGYDAGADWESEAGAHPRGFGGEKRSQDFIAELLRDPRAVVLYGDIHAGLAMTGMLGRVNTDGTIATWMFDQRISRIGEEVGEDLTEVTRAALDLFERVELGVEYESFELAVGEGDGVLDDIVHIKGN